MQRGDLERKTCVSYTVMVDGDVCVYDGDDKGLAVSMATAVRRSGKPAYVVKVKTTWVIEDLDISGASYTVREITKTGIELVGYDGYVKDFDRMADLYRDVINAGGLFLQQVRLARHSPAEQCGERCGRTA